MEPEITDRDEFIVVGVRAVMDVDAGAVSALWSSQFQPRRGDVGGSGGKYYGVFQLIPANGKPSRCEYVAGVEGGLDGIPEGMVGWVVPSGKYARIKAKGLAAIPGAYRDLMAEWLPGSGFKLVDSPIFTSTAAELPAGSDAEWEIHIPVETPEEADILKRWDLLDF